MRFVYVLMRFNYIQNLRYKETFKILRPKHEIHRRKRKMKHEDKIKFMQEWCQKNNLSLNLEGECGFGRECVGVINAQCEAYPDYYTYDDDYEIVGDEDIWVPSDAYHKHPCVAVLGCGEDAEDQLYQWLKWFDDNNYVCVVERKDTSKWSNIEFELFSKYGCKMVKGQTK